VARPTGYMGTLRRLRSPSGTVGSPDSAEGRPTQAFVAAEPACGACWALSQPRSPPGLQASLARPNSWRGSTSDRRRAA